MCGWTLVSYVVKIRKINERTGFTRTHLTSTPRSPSTAALFLHFHCSSHSDRNRMESGIDEKRMHTCHGATPRATNDYYFSSVPYHQHSRNVNNSNENKYWNSPNTFNEIFGRNPKRFIEEEKRHIKQITHLCIVFVVQHVSGIADTNFHWILARLRCTCSTI